MIGVGVVNRLDQLGPSDVEYQEDGSVEVGGEPVDDPDELKGEPIPGGLTDENANDE